MDPGQVIRRERKRRGWSQKKLGAAVGVTQLTIQKIERGKTRKSKHFPKIAEVLGLKLAVADSAFAQPDKSEPVNDLRVELQRRCSIYELALRKIVTETPNSSAAEIAKAALRLFK